MNRDSMWRHARRKWISSVIYAMILAIAGFLVCQPAGAQATTRKVKTRVEPVYPDLARKNNLTGSARVELLITTDGRVKDVKVLGGSPVFVDAVVAAVTKWKYEPAAEESSVVIKFDFANAQ